METDVMPSILDGLNTAKLALSAQQYAMNVTQRNTANVNNPNYTRQDVFFTDLTVTSGWAANKTPGVELWAARNNYLDKSISYELPEFGENLIKYNALREIDALLQGVSGSGLGTYINGFFNSFMELSSSPTDNALRWQVISSAKTMMQEFSRLYNEIQRVQTAANEHIRSNVEDVNILTAKIDDLNGRIETANNLGQLEVVYGLRDERQQYIEDLETKINILYFDQHYKKDESQNTSSHIYAEAGSGAITITTIQGDALVLGDQAFELKLGPAAAVPPSEGSPYGVNIYLDGKLISGNVITDTNGNWEQYKLGAITSGEIGGYLKVRDELIPKYLKTLNEMASDIITEVNYYHEMGYGLDGNKGKFFKDSDIPTSISTPTARNMSFHDDMYDGLTVDANKIAAALRIDEYGDNSNAKLIAGLVNDKRGVLGQLGEKYAMLIYTVGADQRDAKTTLQNQQSVLSQLMSQRDAEHGVSLNEEAINLIKFQRAYQASSRFVTVLNSLSAEILNFVGV